MTIPAEPIFEPNVNIELHHILLELKHGRKQHMRHFIDQYYCYEHQLVNKNGKAKWDLIFWRGLVSKEALKIETKNKDLVVKEHVVPMKVIVNELARIPIQELSVQRIKYVLDSLIVFATITKQEDARLSANGLKSAMPKVHHNFEQLCEMRFGRYEHVGIQLINLD
ncbi:MAG: hypothetical protein RLZZ358_578 [Bacteroidota bacterium]